MMGNLVVVVKKYWLLATIATLAFSLTSCGGKKRQIGGAIDQACSGSIGTFTVSTEINTQGKYDIYLSVESVAENGVYADLSLYSDDYGDALIQSKVALVAGLQRKVATLEYEEFLAYPVLAITSWDPTNTAPLRESEFEYDAACNIGDPAEGTSDNYYGP